MDEPRLHDSSLYLPALPAEYEPARLKTVVQGDAAPWNHLVDWRSVADDMHKLTSQWRELVAPADLSVAFAQPIRMRITAPIHITNHV